MKSSTLYVPIHAGIFTNRKTERLAGRLGLPVPTVVGHLASLWCTALEQSTGGVLRKWDAIDVARAARWSAKPTDLLEALIAEEWLDVAAEDVVDDDVVVVVAGTLCIRSWDDYAGAGIAAREKERKRKADIRKHRGSSSADTADLSADNAHLSAPPSADNDTLSADVPSQLSVAKLSVAKLSETQRNETELSASAAPPAPPAVVKTIQPTMSVATPKGPRWKPGLLEEDRKALEPKTVAEYLACAYEYPHHPATAGAQSFGDVLRADPVVSAAYGPGRMSLEAALEATGWGHWQSQDQMGRDRWVWPTSAPRRIEGWLREAAAKAAQAAAQAKLTTARAEASGIDLAKPVAKADPAREELRKVWRLRHGKGQDLAPCATWIDDVLARGASADELEWFRRATLMPTAPAPAAPPIDADARRASKAAYDRFVETVPPQDRAAGLPQWREWVDAGSPPRWTGPLRQGSGGQPRQAPTGSAANQPPADDPDEVDDKAIADAKAKLAALSQGIAKPKPKAKLALMPSREALDRMLPADLTTDGGSR